MIAGHSRQRLYFFLRSYIHNLCVDIDVCISFHFFNQINSFLDNFEPKDDTNSEMDDGNLNSALVHKDKKRQKRSLHEDS